jgi:hypothetical protein
VPRKKKVEDTPIVETQTEELVVVAPQVQSVMPVHGVEAMSEALDAYMHLQQSLDKKMPEAIVDIKGKLFRTKKYWLTIARAFNLSVGAIPGTEERVVTEDGDWGYKVVYRAVAPGDAFADGDGCVMATEKFGSSGTEHNVRAHAHTRARNRAISNLCGFGEVSADEMPKGGEDVSHPLPAKKVMVPSTPPNKKAVNKKGTKKIKPQSTTNNQSTNLNAEPEYVNEVTFKRDLGNKQLYHIITNHRKYTCIEEEPRVMAEGALDKDQRVEMIYEEKKTKKQPGKQQGSFNALTECNYINDPEVDPATEEIADAVDIDNEEGGELSVEEIPF